MPARPAGGARSARGAGRAWARAGGGKNASEPGISYGENELEPLAAGSGGGGGSEGAPGAGHGGGGGGGLQITAFESIEILQGGGQLRAGGGGGGGGVGASKNGG